MKRYKRDELRYPNLLKALFSFFFDYGNSKMSTQPYI